MSKMQIECAWCGKSMGEKDGQGQEGVTSGICPECKAKVKANKRKKRKGVGDG